MVAGERIGAAGGGVHARAKNLNEKRFAFLPGPPLRADDLCFCGAAGLPWGFVPLEAAGILGLDKTAGGSSAWGDTGVFGKKGMACLDGAFDLRKIVSELCFELGDTPVQEGGMVFVAFGFGVEAEAGMAGAESDKGAGVFNFA